MTIAELSEAVGLLARYRRLRLHAPATAEFVEVRLRLLGMGVVLED